MFIAGMIVLGIGVVIAVLGLIFKAAGKSPYTAQTTGRVVDMCMNAHDFNRGGTGGSAVFVRTGSSGAGTRCPVFEYQVNGVTYRRAGSVAYNVATIRKMMNRQKTVYYDAARPERASLSKHSAMGILGTVFFIIGLAMAALGIFSLVSILLF